MPSPRTPIRRVIVVVLDGLRADAIAQFELPTLTRLRARGASTLDGATVSPSVTAAAMTSLFTGVPPAVHGVESDRFHIPSAKRGLRPMTRVLADSGMPVSVFLAELPFVFRGLGRRFAHAAGVPNAQFAGDDAPDILASARQALATQRRGLILFHWPDADQAGHSHGWMSRTYADAARRLDDALGLLVAQCEVGRDPGTLLIALADHGGGGARPRDHDSPHPLDRTIPIVLAGGGVQPGALTPGASLLDIAPTVLWSLGVPQPAGWSGRPLLEAFASFEVAA
ncbi:MAG: alkaline phosphatase family protein [Gemmatimonadetes bacterium]|nr:alkaline phosphatase family protein [Gemmatimonadota bacterium]